MGAAGMWARSMRRRHRVATVALVLLIAGSSGVTVAAVAAARLADGSIARFDAASRETDAAVFACPPGVDPNTFESQNDVNEQCLNERVARRTADELANVPGVDRASIGGFFVVGVLDEQAPNGWGRLTLLAATMGDDLGLGIARPKLLAGRMPRAQAADEVVLSERTARQGGLEVGDRLRVASWSPERLDRAVNDLIEPDVAPVSMRVVGIGRFREDLVPDESVDVSGNYFGGELHVMGATGRAVRHFANYGISPIVRLRDGVEGIDALESRLAKRWSDQMFSLESQGADSDTATAERRIDTERRALLVFAAIAALASLGFVGLTLVRQFRSEQRDIETLRDLGMARRDMTTAALLRGAVIAVPAMVGSVVVAVALSPLSPVGHARRAEPDLRMRVDVPVVTIGAAVVAVFVLALAASSPTLGLRAVQVQFRTRTRRTDGLVRSLGLAPRLGSAFARSTWPRVAMVVTAVAVAGFVTAGVVVASLDATSADRDRFGASWDLDLGDYSSRETYDAGARTVARNPNVAAVSGYAEQDQVVELDGQAVVVAAFEPVRGSLGPVMVTGRAPNHPDEVAIGESMRRSLDVDIGDQVTMAAVDGSGSKERRKLTVSGTILFNDPVTASHQLGDGAVVTPELLDAFSSYAPQRLLVRLRPGVDIDDGIASLTKSFHGGIRLANPPDDVRNLEGLRRLPWLVAGLIGVLAGFTLTHAMVTTVIRRRGDLAVLSVLGMDRWGIRRITAFTTLTIVLGAAIVGVPLGIIGGRGVWRLLAGTADLLTQPVLGWFLPSVVVVTVTIAALAVTYLTTVRTTRTAPALTLRTD